MNFKQECKELRILAATDAAVEQELERIKAVVRANAERGISYTEFRISPAFDGYQQYFCDWFIKEGFHAAGDLDDILTLEIY